MKRILMIVAVAAMAFACKPVNPVNAVIDSNGDCVFENSVVSFRLNGAGNAVITDGMEAILKAGKGSKTVVEDRHSARAASMNDGGSALLIGDSLYFPHENFDSFELVEQTKSHVIFKLHYPMWLAGEDSLELTRTVTLRENSYYCEVTDIYASAPTVRKDITVVAGFAKNNVLRIETGKDYIIAWESLQGAEGNIGAGVLMPMTSEFAEDGPQDHSVALYKTKMRRPVDYAVGYCWSKGELADFDAWAAQVRF